MSILETLKTEVTVTGTASTNTTSFEMPNWASFAVAHIPSMTDGAIGLEVTVDGTNYAPMLKPDGSADLVVCASGADPAVIDISDHVRALPSYNATYNPVKARFTCAAQTAGASVTHTVTVFFKE